MIQILNYETEEKEKDEESGDIYYTVKLELLDPGAQYRTERNTQISEKVKKTIKKIEQKLN